MPLFDNILWPPTCTDKNREPQRHKDTEGIRGKNYLMFFLVEDFELSENEDRVHHITIISFKDTALKFEIRNPKDSWAKYILGFTLYNPLYEMINFYPPAQNSYTDFTQDICIDLCRKYTLFFNNYLRQNFYKFRLDGFPSIFSVPGM